MVGGYAVALALFEGLAHNFFERRPRYPLLRHTSHALASGQTSASGVLRSLHETLQRESTDDRFCTVAFARLEARRQGCRVELTSGGHPLPLLFGAGGDVESVGVPACCSGHPTSRP